MGCAILTVNDNIFLWEFRPNYIALFRVTCCELNRLQGNYKNSYHEHNTVAMIVTTMYRYNYQRRRKKGLLPSDAGNYFVI